MFDLRVITVSNVDLKLVIFFRVEDGDLFDRVFLPRFNFFQMDSFNILTTIHVVWHINGKGVKYSFRVNSLFLSTKDVLVDDGYPKIPC